VGKSWLACALGHKACRDNRSVLYQRIPRLFTDLALAHGDGRYPRLMRALGGVKLLILDDWGLEPLGAEQRHDLLEIAEERYGRGATLITSQLPVDLWHNVIGDPAGACHPRPTSIGMAGRHQSEQVADFSPESPADIVGIRNECFFSRIRSC
jgi:DNA replication protein DnaC